MRFRSEGRIVGAPLPGCRRIDREQLLDGDRAQAAQADRPQDLRQRVNRPWMEVVQEDDRAGTQAALDVPDDRADPRMRTSSRASTFQNTSTSPSRSEMSSVARECSAYGVRKSRGFQPTCAVDLVLRPHQLEPDEPVRQARQVRVRPGVVADAAEPRLRVRGMRPVREPVADDEERRVRAVAPQDLEERVVYGPGPSSKVSATASP